MNPLTSLAAFGQPRLARPICANMLGEDGVPSSRLLNGIDGLLCDYAASVAAEWQMPLDLPVASDPSDRWLLVSGLQKAVRRGEVEAAMAAAHACHSIDPRYLFRRLGVIAIEDVFLGNLAAVAMTLALIGSKAARDLIGDAKAAVWLAQLLAGGIKDHTACDLCQVVDLDRTLRPTMHQWAALPDIRLAEKALDLDLPVQQRMLAAWLLAGTRRFAGQNLPRDNDRSRTGIMGAMVQSGMPLILYYIADRAALRTGDAMFVSVLPIWQVIGSDDEPDLNVRVEDLTASPAIGPVLAAAWDRHTREGRVALARFAKVPAIARSLPKTGNAARRMDALWAATFIAEGGQLNVRVSSDELDTIHQAAGEVELQSHGLRAGTDQFALLQAIEGHLPALNAIRRDVATKRAKAQSQTRAAPPTDLPGPTTPTIQGDPEPARTPSKDFSRKPLRDARALPLPSKGLDERWAVRPGDWTILAEPDVSPEAKQAAIALALAKLEEMPRGSEAGTVASPFPLVAPLNEAPDFERDVFFWEVEFSALTSMQASIQKGEVALHIENWTTTSPTPAVLKVQGRWLINNGLEVAVAQWLLGEPALFVKAVLSSA